MSVSLNEILDFVGPLDDSVGEDTASSAVSDAICDYAVSCVPQTLLESDKRLRLRRASGDRPGDMESRAF